ncbi:hypothetical protein PHISCL_06951 [Aspergillus sclerotialis]|uniref:Uncharacterized protein n=1 Tax=Aspergillus sclerotialis TaxID=2070753 RepID=A0A3A2ZCP2_9EURO|nr:hypothetical protein PHISCL_06951 [Aspergillus sclerotialis]
MSRASNSKAHIKDHPELQEFRKEAFTSFDNALSFSNHLGIFSEENDKMTISTLKFVQFFDKKLLYNATEALE